MNPLAQTLFGKLHRSNLLKHMGPQKISPPKPTISRGQGFNKQTLQTKNLKREPSKDR